MFYSAILLILSNLIPASRFNSDITSAAFSSRQHSILFPCSVSLFLSLCLFSLDISFLFSLYINPIPIHSFFFRFSFCFARERSFPLFSILHLYCISYLVLYYYFSVNSFRFVLLYVLRFTIFVVSSKILQSSRYIVYTTKDTEIDFHSLLHRTCTKQAYKLSQ